MDQSDYLDLLIKNRLILGEYDPAKVSGLPPQWFWDRMVDLVDFRGDLQIRSAESITFGFHVRVITASHDFREGGIGKMVAKPVWIEQGAFIGSYALLYACHIKQNAVVSVGSVVRNMVVEPWELVEGNPAKVVAKYEDGHWRKR